MSTILEKIFLAIDYLSTRQSDNDSPAGVVRVDWYNGLHQIYYGVKKDSVLFNFFNSVREKFVDITMSHLFFRMNKECIEFYEPMYRSTDGFRGKFEIGDLPESDLYTIYDACLYGMCRNAKGTEIRDRQISSELDAMGIVPNKY